MDYLENLYNSKNVPHIYCEGCSILDKKLPKKCVFDISIYKPADILVLSPCPSYSSGEGSFFPEASFKFIQDTINRYTEKTTISFGVSINCPSQSEKTLSSEDKNKCRLHLYDLVEKVNPKLILACGNTSLNMLFKSKSGIKKYRGSELDFSLKDKIYKVVPIYNPFAVLLEPKDRFLFDLDVKNAIERFITHKLIPADFKYEVLMDFESVLKYKFLMKYTDPISIDLETTGLDFRNDSIHTIALSWKDKSIVIPIDHQEGLFDLDQKKAILWFISEIMKSDAIKIAHNAKFDLKFLMKYGITEFNNIWDTMVMQHLILEDCPKSLKNLVKVYFGNELETL